MNFQSRIIVALAIVILSSCTSTSYIPYIALEAPSDRIDASVKILDFKSNIPDDDVEKGFMSAAASHPESMPADIGVMVTNELIKDFRVNDFFTEISKSNDDADFILSGEINRYKAKYQPLPAAILLFIPYGNIIAMFGIPLFKNEVVLEIKMKVEKKDGSTKEYAKDGEWVYKYNIYNDGGGNLSAATNRALIFVIKDIREKLIADKVYLES